MSVKTPKKCCCCEHVLARDMIGLNKKLFAADTNNGLYRCLACMAEFLECSVEDLQDKIEEFKRQGCKFFS